MAKTLSESAAEILKASMSADKEPMNKNPAPVNDLGGATPTDDYSGPDQHGQRDNDASVGIAAAKAVNQAPKPVVDGAPGEKKFGEVKSAGLAKPATADAALHPNLGEEAASEEEVVVEAKAEDEKDEEEKDDEEAKKEMKEAWKKKAHKSMAEDVDALFNGESLSEEFRTKATTIFEAAVNARIDTIIEEMMAENDTVLSEAVDSIKNEIAGQVDEYMNYVVEQWMEDNKVAVETGLRAELTEDFINGLKNLFAEHYIEIPEEKVDVAEELAQRVVELEEAAAAQEAEKASLVEELNAAKKNESIRKICEGLTETQIAKMTSLAEGVEFTTEGEFNSKLAVIRENYFPANKVKSEVKAIQETTVSEEPEVAEVYGNMAHYVKAITKTAPKA